jgi:hypothetical protein
MRTPRIQAPEGENGLYHCMSRTVGGAFLLGPQEKETFVRQMWRIADFLEIDVLDYVVMSNHYHQLVRVPGVLQITDAQLLAKLRAYYGKDSTEVRAFDAALAHKGQHAEAIRQSYLKRMGNLSEFEKILKQGFSTWYNRRNNRRGTLWMERFKSVLVEDCKDVREIMATYIDLNPVRAEMVEDPKNYRFCGYGAAMGGDPRCRKGIIEVVGLGNWQEAARQYRVCLMERGHAQIQGKKGKVSRELLRETLSKKGWLPPSELLRLRVRYFTDGLVIGTERFVEKVFSQHRSHFGEKRKCGARPVKGWPDASLKVIRDLRLNPVS